MGGNSGRFRKEMKEKIRDSLLAAGAVEVGFSRAGVLPEKLTARFDAWIEEGANAGMGYLKNHATLRKDLDNVLPGCRTVVSMAFSYAPKGFRDESLPIIACYAYGEDYHDVIRERTAPVIGDLKAKYGGEWRLCIDSAPVAERHYALKGGVGFLGKNSCVITKGAGCYTFLAELLTTLEIEPDNPSTQTCEGCGKCINACPTGALRMDSTIDSRKCLSYLTIEKKGDWTEDEKKTIRKSRVEALFGCDICVRVCPHNGGRREFRMGVFQDDATDTKKTWDAAAIHPTSPTSIEEFRPNEDILKLTDECVMKMTPEEFNTLFHHSPLKRAKLAGLRRNAIRNNSSLP